ncbi:MAG: hypothetical protein B6245_18820 [Desulfobacteraceae bacterium 4572_88]|nr:MAG: hypothetical protein B6245_18820 [Desulfobacteraceae bacterium 4572_88]
MAYSLSAEGDIRDIQYRTICLKNDIHFAHCHGQNRMDEVLEIKFAMNRQGRHSDSGNSQNPLAGYRLV